MTKNLLEVDIVDLSSVEWIDAVCGDHSPAPDWWGGGNGAWGCLMSHLRIAQDATRDGLENYCVLEDDVVFHDRAREVFELFVSELPSDWGQIYLGGQYLHQKPERLSDWVLRPFNVNRTHAFGLSKKTYAKFVQHIMHAPDYFEIKCGEAGGWNYLRQDFHIDHQLGRAHERRDWNVYTPSWWIAGQEEGRSNISGRESKRMWWNWGERGEDLPFFILKSDSSIDVLRQAEPYLHTGYNHLPGCLVDIGIDKNLNGEELLSFLKMISSEAVERWVLPGVQIPRGREELRNKIASIWPRGIVEFSEKAAREMIKYPYFETENLFSSKF